MKQSPWLTQRAEDPERSLSHSYLLEVLSAVARALDYAHQRGIVHRDVKPSNIMLDSDLNEIHIVDFGLATHAMADGSTITGTPKYMAPEQWTTERQDGRTDQFALGVVAYEMLSGDVPFAGVDSGSGFGIDQVGRKVASEKIPPVPDLKSKVNAVLAKSMSHSKEARFGSCVEFVQNLAQALGNPKS